MKRKGIKEIILKKPWLLPFITCILKGIDNYKDMSRYLSCSKRLAKSGTYYIRKSALSLTSLNDICIIRKGKYFLIEIGKVYIVAKVLKYKVKTYTVPKDAIENNDLTSHKLRHRINVVKFILKEPDETIGNC